MKDLIEKYKKLLDIITDEEAQKKIAQQGRDDACKIKSSDNSDNLVFSTRNDLYSKCKSLITNMRSGIRKIYSSNKPIWQNAKTNFSDEVDNQLEILTQNMDSIKHYKRPRILVKCQNEVQNFKVFKSFQDEHDIYDIPRKKTLIFYLALLVTMLLLETIMNGVLLAKVSYYGLIGAWLESFVVSLTNILVGFGIGYGPFRTLTKKKNKSFSYILGNIASGVGPIIVIIFNFVFAHYRAHADPQLIENFLAMRDIILNTPFAIFANIQTLGPVSKKSLDFGSHYGMFTQ